ncbi:MAG: hypothetical protein KF886_02035 [Candidatus Hydrogenedentes bacterium]|nr:hypothetical protein [Candidatus Hydrogenedentota bacterium]
MPLIRQFPGPYAALLWAEFAPRARVLSAVVAVLLALSFLNYIQHLVFGSGVSEATRAVPSVGVFEIVILCAAAIGILCCVPRWSEGDITLQPLWQSLTLPVRLHGQILVTLMFHIAVALLLGGVCGLFWHLDEGTLPSLMPVALLVAISLQGQAAMFGCYVLGPVPGFLAFAMGFIAVVTAGWLATPLTPFSPETDICLALAVAGILWCFAAAHLARGGSLPGDQLLPRIPREHFSTRLPAAILRGKSFSSPFWAQVWFEWRSAAMWLPMLVGGATVVNMLLIAFDDFPYSVISMFTMTGIYLIVPFLIASKYNRVSPQYRNFALARPITSQRVGRAKTVSMALAILLTGALLAGPPRLVAIFAGDTVVILGEFLVAGLVLVPSVVVAVYGLLAFAIGLLIFLISFPAALLRYHVLSLFFSDDEVISKMGEPLPGAGALAFIFAAWIVVRAFGRRYGTLIRWPRELWLSVLALLVSVVTGIVAVDETAVNYGTLWYIWVTPLITFGALFSYGLRTGLISRGDTAAGSALFASLYTAAGYAYVFPTELSEHFINMHFGQTCVLLASPIVWYPLAVTAQRYSHDGQSGTTDNDRGIPPCAL